MENNYAKTYFSAPQEESTEKTWFFKEDVNAYRPQSG
jgi:hypothetical protein